MVESKPVKQEISCTVILPPFYGECSVAGSSNYLSLPFQEKTFLANSKNTIR